MFPLIAFSTAVDRWERRLPARGSQFRHFRASEEDILPNLIFLANLFWNFAIFPFLILDRVDLPTLCRHSLGVAALTHCRRLCEFYCLTYEICDWTKKGDDLVSLADCLYVASSSILHPLLLADIWMTACDRFVYHLVAAQNLQIRTASLVRTNRRKKF